MKIEPWEDPNSDGNSPRHRTGKKCIDCGNPAGTAWSPYWCFDCNVKRMRRINASLDDIWPGVA